MDRLTFIDMFAGIGGFRSGMEQAGHQCVGWIEWDKYARQSYQAIYDTKGEYNGKDIRQAKGSDLPSSDVWCFGFPCQDVSVAGKQAGIRQGTRSGLFFEVIRLLEERIRGNKTLPTYLFIENVKNLLSIDGGWGFARVQASLDKVGYDTEWSVVDSAEVVPQHRERIFIVGHLRGQSTRKVFPIIRKDGEVNQTIKEVARIYPDRHSSDANSVVDSSGISHTVTAHSYKDSPKILVVGNVSKTGHHSDDVVSEDGLSKTITAQNAYKHTPKVSVHQMGNISISKSFGGNPQVGRVYSTDGLAPTLNTMQGGGREPKILCESRKSYAIRKLTPLECWRLQGFSDEQFYKAKESGLSNTQLYKQAGNSVTVPVIKAIAERLE